MTDRADQTIKVLRAGHDELAALVDGFTEEDLARRSGASEWDVSQVLSHLGSGAEISLAALDGALNGTGTPQMDFIRGVWARWDGMSRAERAAEVVGANEALVRCFEDLDATARRDLRIELWFPAPAPDVAGFAGMRLSEFAYHTWDVRAAFDPAATLNPEAVELLLDGLDRLLGFLGKADRLGGREAVVEVRTTAPERAFGLEIRDAVRLTDAPGAPDVVLTAPAEWWLRLVSGRHAPEHTPDGVRLTGDALTLDDLRAVFPGF
ncbi:maleylpyruvate isomerase family mycothiol-dependent enzyme [Sphaerisporangium album]|uniref:Maleylpyruvate isomerase family mycothiol-dependent enzyme n=2 Tax=Sphaerisporangium album TaxID=509200 RepID=A0A367EWG3_9ACTN|nr:maleylpyruvate isomerase family mycothiol-dependent enzyme [Sphaerisporangium album]